MSRAGDQPVESATPMALLITGLEVGGAEQALTNLALGLGEHGFRPQVYVLQPRPAAGQDRLVRALESAGIACEFCGVRTVRDAPRALRWLTAAWRRDRPAIAQSFLHHANLLGRLAARRAGVRMVCGIRVAERRGRARLWLDRMTSRWVDHYVCVSADVADFSRREGGLPGDRLSVIPNGVDVPRFAQAEPLDLTTLGVAAGRRAIIYVGRLDEQKRSVWLVEQAPRLLERLPQHDLLLVGDGPLREVVYNKCIQLGVADRVHRLGRRDDVPRLLRASELLVLPSAWEGMPNVVLEAMAAGLPVVATRVEGVAEALGPLAAAQTFDPGDAEGLVFRAFALVGPAAEGVRLGGENQRRVAEHFSVDAMVAAYAAFYRRWLSL
ncbi:MAG: glycosyltransferase [Pirellulales bacterium]|nr:glycosyltransferase [Pirellulales bacterium]